MAKFDVVGLDAFKADLEAAQELTVDEKYRILDAGGTVVLQAMQRKLTSIGLVLTGRLSESLGSVRKVEDGTPVVLVYPQGVHHRYRGRDIRGKRGKGLLKTASAAEVGFVLEYGVAQHNIRATHWMEAAVSTSGEATTDAMQEAFNAVLDEKGTEQ